MYNYNTYKSALIEFVKKNLEFSNVKIAEEFLKLNPKLVESVKLSSLAKRIGELIADKGWEKKCFKPNPVKIKDKIEEDKKIILLRESSSNYRKKYEEILKELFKANKRLELVLDVKENPINYYGIPFKDKNKSQSTAIVLASDWHLGEVVEADTVNHLNEFNYSISIKRVQKFFQSIVKLVEIERTGTEIDTLVLALIGDLITGYIHEDLLENSELSPTECLLELRNLIHSGLEFLKTEGNFNKIIVPTCFGNHGRTTQKKRIATAYKNSFEWLLYKTLEADYKEDKIVEFRVVNSYHNWVNLYNTYNVRFHHGDSIQYNGGIGGITIPVNKAISQWNKSKTAYIDCFGHFHTFLDGGNFLSNGSIIGYNNYSISIKASYELPKQTFFVIDKDRGKTATRPIFVTEKF